MLLRWEKLITIKCFNDEEKMAGSLKPKSFLPNVISDASAEWQWHRFYQDQKFRRIIGAFEDRNKLIKKKVFSKTMRIAKKV